MAQRFSRPLSTLNAIARSLSFGGFCCSGLVSLSFLSTNFACLGQDSGNISSLQARQPAAGSQAVHTTGRHGFGRGTVQPASFLRRPLQAPEPTPVAAANVESPSVWPANDSRYPASRTPVAANGMQQQAVRNHVYSSVSAQRVAGRDSQLSLQPVLPPGQVQADHADPKSDASFVSSAPRNSSIADDTPPIHVYPDGVTLQPDTAEPTQPFRSASTQNSMLQNGLGGHSLGLPDGQLPPMPSMQMPPMQQPGMQQPGMQLPPIQSYGSPNQSPSSSGMHGNEQALPLIPHAQHPLGSEREPILFEPPAAMQGFEAAQQPSSEFDAQNGTHGFHTTENHSDLSSGSVVDTELSWWENDLPNSILRGRQPMPMTLGQALGLALSEAPELAVLQSDWVIQQLEVTRNDAAFDWTTFVNSVWNRDSTPVGS